MYEAKRIRLPRQELEEALAIDSNGHTADIKEAEKAVDNYLGLFIQETK